MTPDPSSQAPADKQEPIVGFDLWIVQQLAAGGRWNTLLLEGNQSDAERAVELLLKSGELNLRIIVQRLANTNGLLRRADKEKIV
jgi:hypothetical protein